MTKEKKEKVRKEMEEYLKEREDEKLLKIARGKVLRGLIEKGVDKALGMNIIKPY